MRTESVCCRSHTHEHLDLCPGLPREVSGSPVESGAGSLSIVASLQGRVCFLLKSQCSSEVPCLGAKAREPVTLLASKCR